MGSTHARVRAIAEASAAEKEARRALQKREANERKLIYQESKLGTEEQLSGSLDQISDEELQFTGRYAIDPSQTGAVNAYYSGGDANPDWMVSDVDAANSFMDQAQEAAKSGDMELAADLRRQAEDKAFSSFGAKGHTSDAVIRSMVDFVENEFVQGREQLGSPMAMTTGEIVHQGREFLDPESETSQRFKSSLTEGALEQVDLAEERALRGVDVDARGAQRAGRDFAMQRGAARSPYRAAQVQSRIGEQFAATKADTRNIAAGARAGIEMQAAVAFENYSRSFAMDSVEFGQAFLQNQGGIREDFQASVDKLHLAQAELLNAAADRNLAFAQMAQDRSLARRQQTIDLVGTIVGAVGGIALAGMTGGLSLAAGAAIMSGPGQDSMYGGGLNQGPGGASSTSGTTIY